MKRSVAHIVTLRVLHILGAALILLLIGAFLFAYATVTKRNNEYSEAIVSMYTDLMVYGTQDKGIAVEQDPEEVVRLGNYICGWYKVDYAYVYIPDLENGTVTYCGAARNPKTVHVTLENDLVGAVIERPLTKEEQKLWNEECIFVHDIKNNEYGHEIGTLTYCHDAAGV